jgi:hypothetical protein
MAYRPSCRLENIQQCECFVIWTEDWLEELLPVIPRTDYIDKVAEKSVRKVIYPTKGVPYSLFRFLLASLLPLLPESWLDYLVHPVSAILLIHDRCQQIPQGLLGSRQTDSGVHRWHRVLSISVGRPHNNGAVPCLGQAAATAA